jgi:hypothetical protein
VGRAHGMHGRGEEIVQVFGGKAQKKQTTRKTQGVGVRMGLEWILGRLDWWVWIGFYWLRIGTGGSLL